MFTAINCILRWQAAETGNRFRLPLGVPLSDLHIGEKLHQGQQSSVHMGSWGGREAVVKKLRISTNADMERYRTELKLLIVLGKHQNLVPLLAARALPPGMFPKI